MCVEDRLQLSEALGLRQQPPDRVCRYPQTAAAQAQRRIVAGLSSLGAREHRWTITARD
jgi:hypothetical protein